MASESAKEGTRQSWTSITSDADLVEHLLGLYFCWEYPTLASLSKEHFWDSFKSGSSKYCSPLLVNALLALGSRFTDRHEARTNPDDPFTAGDAFFEEAKKMFWQQTHHQELTTIQAIGIMSIREASCGRDVDSRYYAGQSVRLAIEMGLNRLDDDSIADEDHRTVQLTTLWGAFSLDHAWSLTTGSLPQFSRFPRFPSKLPLDPKLEEAPWSPYTDSGPNTVPELEQPCHIRTVFNCFCELSEIIHDALYTLHCPARTPTSQAMIDIYNKYLHWYDHVPDALRLGINFTPQVLFVHIYYHFAILHTFRPFLRLRILKSHILPRQLCLQAADAIQTHMRAYSRLYGLRRTPSFLPYVVLGTSRIYLAIEQLSSPGDANPGDYDSWLSAHAGPGSRSVSRHATDALKANMAALDEMAQCHRSGLVGVRMLAYLTRAWGVYNEIRGALEAEAGLMGQTVARRAVAAGRGPDFFGKGHDWNGAAQGESGGGEEHGVTAQEPDVLRSALFWPAARVPPVIVPAGSDLEELGFEGVGTSEGG